MRRYVEELLAGKTGPRGKDFNMRWVALSVADVFRLLPRGGVFIHPRDGRDRLEQRRESVASHPC